ncbi:MAG: bifunctional phosphopantothenoylcysteine decarboxylase/phosphopantothenate--cysteine ligase CoaBC [Prochlorococcus sp.]|nr:bifunctional phosphopantothenoylcysteine decarboxylase/phosphopantothenate--cysteine ligase CoaBC [Prochlorococcaceae cyanobacterium ETNP2_MAG_10]MDP6320932.1 bifunctional phosphopantothenoylcysteine decarboxylase/phosphopantothenate--cysteine ligase CoaBC [Prochlorococcaceae cyanobacterium ETNP14_MAG_5]MDP6851346.1 bifunctional phosphopantothenoylcysteine decarboxylase/phosphopantothenate--cysteine ligase CoaBC [Prochlorococcaceae cyanobacterium ETNP1_MAG_8]
MKTEAASPLVGRRLLVAVTGSIAAVKTPLLVSALIKAGAEVRCLVTPSAARLVSPVALASLSRHRCYQDEDQWNPSEPRPLHIALAEWAEIVIVAPLSATSLARWTHGLAEGLLASVLLASERPVVAAAAMNTAMWSNPAVRRNWLELQSDPRVLQLAPESGLLACDRLGDGRMVDPKLIELAVASGLLQVDQTGRLKRDWQGRRLLVSAGPTLEALDQARLLTNRSSGRMGVLLAQAARLRGAEVDLVHGPLNLPLAWLEGLETHSVTSAVEMQSMLLELQPSADAVVMAAAVADVRRFGSAKAEKLPKDSFLKSLEQDWEEVPDLLAELVLRRTTGQVLLGFAALAGDDAQIQALGEEKRLRKGCDLLMANPIDRPGQGFEANLNGGWLLAEGGVRSLPVTSKLVLAHQLLDALLEVQVAIPTSS